MEIHFVPPIAMLFVVSACDDQAEPLAAARKAEPPPQLLDLPSAR